MKSSLRTSTYAGVAFAALLAILTNNAPAAENKSGSRVPVLLELFTSEGCSSCPPADRLLETFDKTQPFANADLIVLSEHVDYWDRLGWKDPYSQPQFSARQQEYADRFNRDGVYTPQLVVDGRFEFVGSDQRAASSAIQKAAGDPKIPIVLSNVVRKGSQITASIEVRGAERKCEGHFICRSRQRPGGIPCGAGRECRARAGPRRGDARTEASGNR